MDPLDVQHNVGYVVGMTSNLIPAQVETLDTVTLDRALEELRRRWIGSMTSPRTRDAYGRDFSAFLTWCEEENLEALLVDPSDLDAYREHLLQLGRTPSTVARHLAALSSFFRYSARATQGRFRSPMADGLVARPKVSKRTDLGLGKNDAARLIQAADNPRDLALVSLLAHSGLRVSEALSIRLEDFGEQAGREVVTITRKGGKVQDIVLAPSTLQRVRALAGERETGFLFETSTGRAMDRVHAFRIVKRLAARAGLDPKQVRPHALRHTWATTGIEAGVPLRAIQRDAGHSSATTTELYLDALEATKNPTADVVAALLG